jgi:two-component system, chemotaxis family, sensor kinase Cph1
MATLLQDAPSSELSGCEGEPVHIPGAIQPHGLLFVLDAQDLTIRTAGDNTIAILGIPAHELIGRHIDTIATLADGTNLVAAMRRADLEQHNPLEIRLCGASFDAIAHRHDGRLILECEPELAFDARFVRRTSTIGCAPAWFAFARAKAWMRSARKPHASSWS